MPRGGARPNSGPKKGQKTPRRIALEAAIDRVTRIANEGDTPAEYLLKVMRNENESTSIRMQAAIGCAPYVHRKQPTAIEQTVTLPASVVIVTPLTETAVEQSE